MRTVSGLGRKGNTLSMARAAGVALATTVAVVVAVGVAVGDGDAGRPPSTEQHRVGDDRTASVSRANRGGGRSPVAATSSTSTTVDTAPGWEQRRGQAALALLGYPWQAVGYRVEFVPVRAGYLGMTWPERRLIRIYVRAGHTVEELARTTAHELGHALDWTSNDSRDRALYREVRGIGGSGWFACSQCTDLSTPAGDFAETFSYWVLEGRFPSRSRIGSPIDVAQLIRLEALFAAPPA